MILLVFLSQILQQQILSQGVCLLLSRKCSQRTSKGDEEATKPQLPKSNFHQTAQRNSGKESHASESFLPSVTGLYASYRMGTALALYV